MPANIYRLHEAAFSNVSAFVVAKYGCRVATVALKFPRDGAGRLYAYVHIFGAEMSRGFAAGGGYDKRSAAVEAAVAKHSRDAHEADRAHIDAIKAALAGDSGADWTNRLKGAGFDVWQAV